MELESLAYLTTLEIKSDSSVFTGVRPEVLEGQFDVFADDKIFHLSPEGISQLSLGTAAAIGLSVETVLAFAPAGSISNGGAASFSLGHVRDMTVSVPNTAPFALDDSGISINAGSVYRLPLVSLLANDQDSDGDELTVVQIDETTLQGAGLSLDNEGNLLIDSEGIEQLAQLPDGVSVLDQFSYTVSDGRGGTSSANVVLTIRGVNDLPQAQDDEFELLENDGAINVTTLLLRNDRELDTADSIRISSVDTTNTIGRVTLTDGRIEYDPDPEFDSLRVGETAIDSFEYSIVDEQGASATATVTVTITGESDIPNDFDGDGEVNAHDIDELCRRVQSGGFDETFDLDGNDELSLSDLDELISNVFGTTYGDSNLDGVFNSTDLIHVFIANEYEDGVKDNSGWASGDWNCDREFDSSDLVRAFQARGYTANAVTHRIDAAAAIANLDDLRTKKTWRAGRP
ncbi:Ig-like domain-containing protein [Planctomycetota bacterium]